MDKNETKMTVIAEGEHYNRTCDLIKTFVVQRPGSGRHIVTVRCSADSGTPQDEYCDCSGFKYRGKCSHVDAVYQAKVLTCEW